MNALSKVIQELEGAEQNKSGMFELGEETMCTLMDLLTKELEAAVPVAYLIQDRDDRQRGFYGSLSHHSINSYSDDDIACYELSQIPLYTVPPAQPVAVDEIAEQQGVDPKVTDAYMQGWHDHAAQPVAVPDFDTLRLRFEASERESDNGFNLHKYGIGYADEATQTRWETWIVCRAAMLNQAPVNQPASNSPEIPDGWKLVPVEPTPEMLQSGIAAHYERSQVQIHDKPAPGPMECAYASMLAAAPGKEG